MKQFGQPHWRLGTTSCIWESSLLDNVRALAGRVRDVELVLYDNGEVSNWPNRSELAELRDLAQQYDLTYTAHVPCPLGVVNCDKAWERRSVDLVGRTVEAVHSLQPLAYTWHWDAEQFGPLPSEDIPRWHKAVERVAVRVREAGWLPVSELAVETLSYSFDIIGELVRNLGYSVTLDVGHLWVAGFPWQAITREWLDRIRVVHVHGIDPVSQCDHHSLKHVPSETLRELWALLASTRGELERSLSIEVFSESDWKSSVNAWRMALKQ